MSVHIRWRNRNLYNYNLKLYVSCEILWVEIYSQIKLHCSWEVIFVFDKFRTRHNRTYKPIFIDIASEEGAALHQSYEEEFIDETYNEEYNEKLTKRVRRLV